MKGQRNYSSWAPLTKFKSFYNEEKPLNYSVAYFNPNGTPWYSEKLEAKGRNADRTVVYESPSPWGETLDTKSTDATGVFSFKITNDDTKELLYEGKFKVGKFSTANGGQDKNNFEFFLGHDWLMSYGMIGFHHSLDEVGGMPPLMSVWIKGTQMSLILKDVFSSKANRSLRQRTAAELPIMMNGQPIRPHLLSH
ncbi:hypothetical protein [Leptolyngbya sp. 7M]|uniref:hypothetical protein n=1 Tax=Leptolyngbya sp. 7M TaxID=2812896 RepID=UPI001B8B077F|nr:hypothetical protein [Leptolyngbya sp. 7M]QYO65666.1 hypothetical protein JVX88_02435 [Leptolyngbya sp. 7M]